MSQNPGGLDQPCGLGSINSLLGNHNPLTQMQTDSPLSAGGLSIINIIQQNNGSNLSALPRSNLGQGSAFLRSPHASNTPHTPMNSGDSGIPKPQLQNIVCTVYLGCSLDLKSIALSARNAEYNPKRFAAVIMRIREPRTTALIFASGKMVCTGAKSEEQARLAARKYARIIQKLGFDAHFKEFKIQNMVGSCDVKFHIRLEGLYVAQSRFATYEPELFPGLIYRMARPKIVLLVFVSGKIVITGAKVREEIYEAFNNIYPILKKFQTSDKTRQTPQPY